MALCCQCCVSAVSALLKECESLKEKQLFCFTISAARKKFSRGISLAGVFLLWVARLLPWATMPTVIGLSSLTPGAPGSILNPDAAYA